MDNTIHVGQYQFAFQVFTTGNCYDVELDAPAQQGDTITARASILSYGEGSGQTPGLFKVVFTIGPQGLTLQAQAQHHEPIKGIKIRVSLLPHGTVMTPTGARWSVERGARLPFSYPDMQGQFLLIDAPDEMLCIKTQADPPPFLRYWITDAGDQLLAELYSEAYAYQWNTTYTGPLWHIVQVASWQAAVDDYTTWAEHTYGLVPFAQRRDVPVWLREAALAVVLHGVSSDGKMCHTFDEMALQLQDLAAVFPAERTLVKLLGFEGRVDMLLPDNLPGEELGGHAGFVRFMQTAHELGYKILLHLNIWGMTYNHPLFAQMQEHQIIDGAGRPAGWAVDYDSDGLAEPTFAYISPDAAAFRAVLTTCIERLMQYAPDAIHLDQSGYPINDARHDHIRGVRTLFRELGQQFPQLVLGGEGTGDWLAPLYPLSEGQGGGWHGVTVGYGPEWQTPHVNAELYRRVIGRYMRSYGHSASLPPEPRRGVWAIPREWPWWSEEKFRGLQQFFEQLDVLPTLVLTDKRVSIQSDLARLVLERAQRWLTRQS